MVFIFCLLFSTNFFFPFTLFIYFSRPFLFSSLFRFYPFRFPRNSRSCWTSVLFYLSILFVIYHFIRFHYFSFFFSLFCFCPIFSLFSLKNWLCLEIEPINLQQLILFFYKYFFLYNFYFFGVLEKLLGSASLFSQKKKRKGGFT